MVRPKSDTSSDIAMTEAALPALYGNWMRAIAGGPIPAETKATCDECAMLAPEGQHAGPEYFSPITKCCAFQPHLPNYLAGMILSDSDPVTAASRETLEQRIARKSAITPAYAGPGSVFGLLYRNTPNVFGRAPDLRCQFLSADGGCGVWKYRPGVCATWFCKHVRGATAARFWRLSEKILRHVENDLSLWCLAQMKTGLAEVADTEAASTPDVSELGGEIDWNRHRDLWGQWVGRENEFYRECGKLVAPLSWERVREICGPRVGILAGLMRDAYDHLLSNAIPDRLRLSEFRLAGIHGNSFRVVAYSQFDPLVLTEELARTLRYFDGRPTEEALAAIAQEQALDLDLELVRKMVDFGLLEASAEHRLLPILA